MTNPWDQEPRSYRTGEPVNFEWPASTARHVRGSGQASGSSVAPLGNLWELALNRPWAGTGVLPIREREAAPCEESLVVRAIKSLRLLKVLHSFQEEDENEQRETWDYLKRVLDEDRLSNRKLFPET